MSFASFVFQACAIDHSAISPSLESYTYRVARTRQNANCDTSPNLHDHLRARNSGHGLWATSAWTVLGRRRTGLSSITEARRCQYEPSFPGYRFSGRNLRRRLTVPPATHFAYIVSVGPYPVISTVAPPGPVLAKCSWPLGSV